MSISKTLVSLSQTGRPVSDTEMLRWANSMAHKSQPSLRPLRSFKDPDLSTGLFLLAVLEGMRPGIVDPDLIVNVGRTGPYEDRRQNGASCLPQ